MKPSLNCTISHLKKKKFFTCIVEFDAMFFSINDKMVRSYTELPTIIIITTMACDDSINNNLKEMGKWKKVQ